MTVTSNSLAAQKALYDSDEANTELDVAQAYWRNLWGGLSPPLDYWEGIAARTAGSMNGTVTETIIWDSVGTVNPNSAGIASVDQYFSPQGLSLMTEVELFPLAGGQEWIGICHLNNY